MTRAPDGSPVELYAKMPSLGEPEQIHAVVPPGCEILELGCAAGRTTHRLVELGHRVVAVDESEEMLSHVRGAETVAARIEGLDLGRRFAAVVLASNFVNTPEERQRRQLLATCRRHVADDGAVLIERLQPDAVFAEGAESGTGEFKIRLTGVRRHGSLVSATAEYDLAGARYEHAFTSRILDDGDLQHDLLPVGLGLRGTLDDKRRWLELGALPAAIVPQLEPLVAGIEDILGGDLVGVYLHGSAVLGCFGPRSDIDLVAVLTAPTSLDAKRRLAELLLALSAPYDPPGSPRPVELDVVLEENLRPWRFPTVLDFHFSEEFRDQLGDGGLEAWEGLESRNLAAHVTVLRRAGIALTGPAVRALFPEVPWSDYADALTHDLGWCRTRFVEFPRYGVLSIARIWATLAEHVPHSKASAAVWALPRLPLELQPVLQHGLALYTSADERERWDELPVARYVEHVATQIDGLG